MSRISVLVVDDSVVVRRLVSDVLSSDPRIEVVGTASNGKIALAKMPQLNPDVVTLDIEMPIMDGLETLVHMRELYPATPVIMFSTLTERGAHATLDALERGAHDYVTKPANVGSVTASMEAVRRDLIPKIEGAAISRRGRAFQAPSTPPPPVVRPTAVPPRDRVTQARVEAVVIGVSTGGPDALTTVISALHDLPVPIAVVQHMPPIFTALFADRLNGKTPLAVSEAKAGDRLEAGRVLVAPGDYHLRLRKDSLGVTATLDQGTPENYCRPAVDVLFRSAADIYGGGVLGVVLTGMGSDGARGAGRIVEAGGSVIVQDETTSVVWGMPGAVVGAGLADDVLPLRDVAGAIQSRVAKGRSLIGAKGVARS